MLHAALPSDPSPLTQTGVYMAGIMAGYLLLTRPEEWARVREALERLRGR
jgi:hypothetical protein